MSVISFVVTSGVSKTDIFSSTECDLHWYGLPQSGTALPAAGECDLSAAECCLMLKNNAVVMSDCHRVEVD